jgi:hypothetical protein
MFDSRGLLLWLLPMKSYADSGSISARAENKKAGLTRGISSGCTAVSRFFATWLFVSNLLEGLDQNKGAYFTNYQLFLAYHAYQCVSMEILICSFGFPFFVTVFQD